MKIFKYLLLLTAGCFFLGACSDDDDFQETILVAADDPMTALDTLIWENFTRDYNMDIIYKWRTFLPNPEVQLVPPFEDRVAPFLDVIRKTWMEPYLEIGGDMFFKKYSPKQVLLIGSIGYMESGLYLLGEAEQGHRITMYGLNVRDAYEESVVRQFTHDFHHEFVHILHQNIPYPTAFELICAGDYTTNWQSTSLSAALGLGFVSNYAMADPNEDFAEMISYFLIHSEETWESIMNSGGSGSPLSKKFKEKETIILQYMKNNYGIDLYELRTIVQTAMKAITG